MTRADRALDNPTVQLSRLSGRDYYDGVILLERIDAVILKIRGK